MTADSFVVPIPALYACNEELDLAGVNKYLNYLEESGVTTVMTTAGTSQYNLLSFEEIVNFNKQVCESFKGKKIIGVPQVSFREACRFVKELSTYEVEDVSFMFLYPERFYDEETILLFFKDLRKQTKNPIYIHDMPIRKATGGTWQYSSDILNKLGTKVLGGIKEEHTNLASSYDFVLNLNKNYDIIVAGGSMRRFEYLKNAGANAFLSGIGNIYPQVEADYCSGASKHELIDKENRLFSVFMKHGWHASLRYGMSFLKLCGPTNRRPFVELKQHQKEEIESILRELKE